MYYIFYDANKKVIRIDLKAEVVVAVFFLVRIDFKKRISCYIHNLGVLKTEKWGALGGVHTLLIKVVAVQNVATSVFPLDT